MFKVYLDNDFLGEFEIFHDAMDFAFEQAEKLIPVNGYCRFWAEEDVVCFDYGSHTSFYYIKPTDGALDMEIKLKEYVQWLEKCME